MIVSLVIFLKEGGIRWYIISKAVFWLSVIFLLKRWLISTVLLLLLLLFVLFVFYFYCFLIGRVISNVS